MSRTGSRSAKATDAGVAPEAAVPAVRCDRLAWVFAAIVAAILGLNLLLPRSYTIFAVDPLSYLPLGVGLAWTACIVALIVGAGFWRNPRLGTRVPLLGVAAILCVSFFAFRVLYATIQDDGEHGPLQWDGKNLMPYGKNLIGGVIPLPPRLHTVLWYWATRLFGAKIVAFDYRFPILDREALGNDNYILVTMLIGVAVVVLTTALLYARRVSALRALACQVALLCSYPLLMAYGHIDNYIASTLAIAVWYAALFVAGTRPPRWYHYAGLPAAAVFGFWAHPYFIQLLPLTGLFIALSVLDRSGIRWPGWVTVALPAVALTISPFLGGVGNRYLFESGIPGVLLYERLQLCLIVCLPTLLLLGVFRARNPRLLARPAPLPATLAATVLAALGMFVSFNVEQATYGEFDWAIFGSLIVGAAVAFWLTPEAAPAGAGAAPPTATGDEKPLIYVALLSLFLFAPRVYIYSGDLYYQRFAAILPRDQCYYAASMSPYVLVGLRTPVDTAEDRARKLKAFETGAFSPLPIWDKFRELNHLYYVAWCFEVGEEQKGLTGLLWYFKNNPQGLMDLWRGGTRFTNRCQNNAYHRIRAMSRRIIDENLKANPTNAMLKQLSEILIQFEQKDP